MWCGVAQFKSKKSGHVHLLARVHWKAETSVYTTEHSGSHSRCHAMSRQVVTDMNRMFSDPKYFDLRPAVPAEGGGRSNRHGHDVQWDDVFHHDYITNLTITITYLYCCPASRIFAEIDEDYVQTDLHETQIPRLSEASSKIYGTGLTSLRDISQISIYQQKYVYHVNNIYIYEV